MTNKKAPRPSLDDLNRELADRSKSRRRRRAVRSTMWALIVVAAAAALCSTFLLSVLKVQGRSMEPTLRSGEILLVVKRTAVHPGDVIAFYYNNKILLKRVAASAGDEVDVRADGTVTVNGAALSRPDPAAQASGAGDVTFPEQVPDGRLFVLGDNSGESVDSRFSAIGCVSEAAVIGKVVLRIWPLGRCGAI
jgi:signal peptidase I